ncbi:F-box/WD repeat-containing protein 9-like [Gigantopelta aegis]|uniref:F-box/WD repeat-containing protein 9-like n=1 Tax=Gigantopelta aegis TaxID=1735272 RepID=UPI001B889FAF|nr:F-box/WD repeat-containing protein 9-like [Gigantopelta aegis]XP_041359839.1 F-box/WD repeat-containing protein 9-like [Gigantopelta aegis]
MSDHSLEADMDNPEGSPPHLLTLEDLPDIIILSICNFLDAHVINMLMQMSMRFNHLLSGDHYWRMRIGHRWPKLYPAIPVDPFDWQQACVEREHAHKVWTNVDDCLEHFTYNAGLFASVDAVHLMQDGQLLATGSRDRYLSLLNLQKYDVNKPTSKGDMKIYSNCKIHKGWIWSIKSLDNVLATASWDTYIRRLDLNADLTMIDNFKCKSAVLDIHIEPNGIIAAGYDSRLYLVDPREGAVTSMKIHKRPVLCLSVDDHFIVSGSEDKTISVFDRTAGKVMKTVELESFPMCLHCMDNQLWIGDKGGKLNLCDTTGGVFHLVDTYEVGHLGKVTGIVSTRGALYTCSTDRTVKILEPTRNPDTINTLTSHTGDVAGISYQNRVLASAGSDVCVGIWRPKPTDVLTL